MPDREANWTTVHRLADWLESAGAEGVHGAVPTYDSVLVEFDPVPTSARQVRAFVQLGLRQLGNAGTPARGSPREFDVPVVYGGEYGPDLERVAEQQGSCRRGSHPRYTPPRPTSSAASELRQARP